MAPRMRRVMRNCCLLIALAGAWILYGWIASGVAKVERASEPSAQVHWVRTRHGWVKSSCIQEIAPRTEPPLHPLPVAILLSLASIAALAAFPVAGRNSG